MTFDDFPSSDITESGGHSKVRIFDNHVLVFTGKYSSVNKLVGYYLVNSYMKYQYNVNYLNELWIGNDGKTVASCIKLVTYEHCDEDLFCTSLGDASEEIEYLYYQLLSNIFPEYIASFHMLDSHNGNWGFYPEYDKIVFFDPIFGIPELTDERKDKLIQDIITELRNSDVKINVEIE